MKDAFGTWFWVNLPASSFCSSQVSRCGEGQYRSPWQLQGTGWSGCGNEHGCSGGGVPKDPKVLSTLQRLRMFQDVWGIEVPTAIAIFRSSSKCLLLLIKFLTSRPRAIEKHDLVERGFQKVSPSTNGKNRATTTTSTVLLLILTGPPGMRFQGMSIPTLNDSGTLRVA